MIEFVTLLLGLVSGVQAVEVSVSREVATVEALLDGTRIATTDHWPWILECDFGEELAPHELVVVARDREGLEVGRVRQWVNRPRERVEARLVVDRQARGVFARVMLTDVEGRKPSSVRWFFDGQQLPTPVDLDHIQLPAHAAESPHFLRAEVVMSSTEHAYAELVFGGSFGHSVDRELSALVVSAEGRPATPSEMAGWFEKNGKSLEVAAVERGTIDVVIVRERSRATLESLGAFAEAAARQRARARRPIVVAPLLGTRDRVRFALPTMERDSVVVGENRAVNRVEQVPVTSDVAGFGSLLEIITDLTFPDLEPTLPKQQLADAVAIAGLAAAKGHRRRTVLLITAGDSIDTSRFGPAIVEAYLAKLAVPLVVWQVGKQGSKGAENSSRWQGAKVVKNHTSMSAASNELRKQLESQVVIWLVGPHLSHEIELSAMAKGVLSIERRGAKL